MVIERARCKIIHAPLVAMAFSRSRANCYGF
jgi:hypothetical protein